MASMMRHSSIVHFEGRVQILKNSKPNSCENFRAKRKREGEQRDRENSGNGTDKGIIFRGAESDRKMNNVNISRDEQSDEIDDDASETNDSMWGPNPLVMQ